MSAPECKHGLAEGTCSICNAGEELGVITECRSCHGPIVWCLTERGKRMPVDAVPVESGTFVKVATQDGSPVMSARHAPEGARYTSHFATCPDAADWRRR